MLSQKPAYLLTHIILHRGIVAVLMLENFKGYLQTDGYAVYDSYAKKKEVTHLAFWAHARREYEKA